MKISTIKDLLDARIISGEDGLDADVCSACGGRDSQGGQPDVLLTGLVNPQVIRTAEMMDMRCVVFVRSKLPSQDMIALARENGIVLLATGKRMYEACGILYSNGLRAEEAK